MAVVALRKESVDRNGNHAAQLDTVRRSLSARRAWIEINIIRYQSRGSVVALRKESVDRNIFACYTIDNERRSLSARRAWIEIVIDLISRLFSTVALRKESVDRNQQCGDGRQSVAGRSPQGERG